MNDLFAKWISFFYGYPTFAWVPTHNLNHHKFVNKPGDATITWRYTNKNNWLVASTYFFVSSYWQSEPIKAYIRKARAQNPKLYKQILSQYFTWGGLHLCAFGIALALHGFRTGLVVWFFGVGLPAYFGVWSAIFFNYLQHVHTDPWSSHNHSRNFTGRIYNFVLFNVGFHGAHHENAGAHWSTLPALHAKIAPEIHPDLKIENSAWWLFKTYALALLWPRYGTHQIGRAPYDTGHSIDLVSGDVDAVEAGITAQMI
jgi:hypothetical protein